MLNLDHLNNMQKKAILQTEGPVLILAGAGSGKTTVLVNRIAYIIESKNVRPQNIMAITFTNKAANEMKERVEKAIGDLSRDMWLCTFHSACVRILRSHIALLGFEQSFVIYDTSDTKTVLKECYKDLDIDEKNYPLRSVSSIISKAKDAAQTPEIFKMIYSSDFRMEKVAEIYALYQKKLRGNNALDFDDILMFTVQLLSEYPEVLKTYQERFRYIMVDEYQDTNNLQYMLISMLAETHQNICVVGDDDQSIYKFRGANIQNILNFEKTFDNATVIKLEQNYRSTQSILDAANSVIHNNKARKSKALWTENQKGDVIKLHRGYNERDEALYIANTMEKLHQNGTSYSDMAVLYRTNAQSRVIEELLMRSAIPYKVFGGLRFYDRKEIKDIIAYLRLIHNVNDNLSFQRIINEPKRSIGKTTLDKIGEISNEYNISYFEVAKYANQYPALSRSAIKLIEFCQLILDLKKAQQFSKLTDFIEKVLQDSGYMPMLVAENTVESKTRIDNLGEFLSAVAEYEKTEDGPSLAGFLENISLVSDLDGYDDQEEVCVLMTIHSAKGLEFPVVFLSGMEEGLFPSARSSQEIEDLEEERRLCYVAITRAKNHLYITNARSRTLYGQTTHQTDSRFLSEIPSNLLEEDGNTIADKGFAKTAQIPQIVKSTRSEIFRAVSSATSSSSVDLDYTPGERVKHKKFGTGTIVAVQKFEKDAMLEIAFDSGETKRLMAVFAKLTKL
ncbi:MAG: DNA helicase PcrA [Ruminococcaceae bacterium]|nr:DNA helicase PcrA [Oscillospiraceae bacterium]